MRIGLLLPGQGFQRTGILTGKIKRFPEIIKPILEEVDSVLPELRLSRPLTEPGFEESLTPTHIAQPLILTASYALSKTLETDGNIQLALGHSLGEISALACSGVLSFSDAVNLVHKRGLAMTSAAKSGTGMLVLLKPRNFSGDWNLLLEEVSGLHNTSIANYNSLGQTVISGSKTDLESTMTSLRKLHPKLISQELQVSGAFHSQYMKSAQPELVELVKGLRFNEPAYKIISNKTAREFASVEEIRESIPQMLVTPVRWQQGAEYAAKHVDKFISVGPGRIGKMTAREYPIDTEYYEQ